MTEGLASGQVLLLNKNTVRCEGASALAEALKINASLLLLVTVPAGPAPLLPPHTHAHKTNASSIADSESCVTWPSLT